MKSMKKILLLLYFVSFNVPTQVHADLLSMFGFKKETSIDVVIGGKTENDIQQLKKEISTLATENKALEEDLQVQIEKARSALKEIEARTKPEQEDMYVTKQ